MKNSQKAKQLLTELANKANQAIDAIDNNKPSCEITTLAIEDIDELTEQISATIFGNNLLRRNRYLDVKH